MSQIIDADFLDFGCSKGGSITWARQIFGLQRGVGVDIDPDKVATTRAAGFEAITADASALELQPKSVSFCVMSHFLEHLPGSRVAEKCISSACRVSRDFVYIRHPWFDADYDLWKLGYKFYWSDWSGHTLPLGVGQLDNLIRRSRAKEWKLYGRRRLMSLNDQAVVPLATPINSQALPNERPAEPVSFVAYHEVAALIRTGSEESYHEAKMKLAKDHVPLGE